MILETRSGAPENNLERNQSGAPDSTIRIVKHCQKDMRKDLRKWISPNLIIPSRKTRANEDKWTEKKKAYYDLCPVPFKMKAHWDGMGFFSPFSTLCMLCLSFQGLAFTHFTSKSWALWMGNLMKRKMSWHFSLYISQGNERIFTLKCWKQLNSFSCLDKTVSGIPHWWKIRQKGLNI